MACVLRIHPALETLHPFENLARSFKMGERSAWLAFPGPARRAESTLYRR